MLVKQTLLDLGSGDESFEVSRRGWRAGGLVDEWTNVGCDSLECANWTQEALRGVLAQQIDVSDWNKATDDANGILLIGDAQCPNQPSFISTGLGKWQSNAARTTLVDLNYCSRNQLKTGCQMGRSSWVSWVMLGSSV